MTEADVHMKRLQRGFVAGIEQVELGILNRFANILAEVRQNEGRLFVLGLGGSAGHASHATNDFRKLCAIEAYCPSDNVSELTARINDEGFDSIYSAWLDISRLGERDCLLFFSVGGGSRDRQISLPLIAAADFAKSRRSSILSIVGRSSGELVPLSDACIVLRSDDDLRTPVTEGLTAVVWHMLVSHPTLQTRATKW